MDPRVTLVTILVPTPTIRGLRPVAILILVPLGSLPRTAMASTTWQATPGSGAGTGMELHTLGEPTREELFRARTACCAAAVGACSRPIADRRTGSTPPRRAAAMAWGSVRSCLKLSKLAGERSSRGGAKGMIGRGNGSLFGRVEEARAAAYRISFHFRAPRATRSSSAVATGSSLVCTTNAACAWNSSFHAPRGRNSVSAHPRRVHGKSE